MALSSRAKPNLTGYSEHHFLSKGIYWSAYVSRVVLQLLKGILQNEPRIP